MHCPHEFPLLNRISVRMTLIHLIEPPEMPNPLPSCSSQGMRNARHQHATGIQPRRKRRPMDHPFLRLLPGCLRVREVAFSAIVPVVQSGPVSHGPCVSYCGSRYAVTINKEVPNLNGSLVRTKVHKEANSNMINVIHVILHVIPKLTAHRQEAVTSLVN